jgi:hypothetical protein
MIIGSAAIKHWFPHFPREPKDHDIWSIVPKMNRKVDDYWDHRLQDWLDIRKSYGYLGQYLTPDELYTLKVSHSPWELKNGSWAKHMHDVVWLKNAGARFIRPMYDILLPIWKDLHGPKRVNLNQESGAFFTDAVVRIYDHDSIHDTVAHYDRPLWMEVLKDDNDVAMDMAKVWALPFDRQIELFREEVYATALERWLIPQDYEMSPSLAYSMALRKTITSLTKGDSSLFMILNYDIFRQLPKDCHGDAWYLRCHQENKHMLVKL